MGQPLVNRIPFAKILIGLALVFLLSLGLCGLTVVMSGSANSQANKIIDPMSMGALAGMLGSVAGLIVTCIVWVVLAIVAGTATKVSQPQGRSKNEDGTKLDKDL